MQLEQTLEQEQEQQISKLTKKIHFLEKETRGKQFSLEKVLTIMGVVVGSCISCWSNLGHNLNASTRLAGWVMHFVLV